MTRFVGLSAIVLLAGACEEGATTPEEITCAILSPADGTLVHDRQAVEIGHTGPVVRVELLAGDEVVASADVLDEAAESVTLEWDSAASADGSVTLTARALGDGETSTTSEPLPVDVDNTAPVVRLGLDRFGLVRGDADVALDLVEAHPATVRVVDQFGTVYDGPADASGSFPWDATAAEERVHWLDVEVVDAAGHSGSLLQFPVIVVNHGDAYEVEYDPAARLFVPADYATVEYHTRGMVPTHAGVKRLISWITWDPEADWLVEYSIGEGLCPHRGISFISEESRSGEIVLELGRDELPSSIITLFPAEDRASSSFPTNDDPLTFGMFFGHASPLEPAEHVEETLPIEMHYVLIDEPPAP
ncbi:MAG: Ig-like domain-containing protein [Deltaproteobacteria bacterium]|nr:Ig-like domain-containing protein [Deltaproteobacteria bacterium]